MMSHLAAALGKRVGAVFGPSDPGACAPFANQEGMVVKDVCGYRPCMDRCLMPSPVCMESVGPQEVITKIRGVNDAMMNASVANLEKVP